jgi:hypothetical protein
MGIDSPKDTSLHAFFAREVLGRSVCITDLFRVRRDVLDDVSIALNSEVKPPAAVDTGLPSVFGLIVFLGAQAGMVEVAFQKRQLF